LSSPQSGVRLLEDIFLRVRNAPQVAMAIATPKAASPAKDAEDRKARGAAASTNYKLAIRPQEPLSKSTLPPSPTMQVLKAPGEKALPQVALGTKVASYAPGSSNEPGRDGSDMWLGSRYRDLSASSTLSEMQAGEKKEGLWEREESKDNAADRIASAPAARPRPAAAPAPMPLHKAVGRFYEAARQLDVLDERPTLRDYREAPAGASSGSITTTGKAVPGQKIALAPPSTETLQYMKEKAQEQAYLPFPRDRRALSAGESASESSRRDAASRLKSPGGLPPANMGKWVHQPGDNQYGMRSDRDEFKRKAARSSLLADKGTFGKYDRNELVAMFPPNVVTGTTLIRLGFSQSQSQHALNSMHVTGVKREKIGNWAVWTCSRGNESTPALQLFLRNSSLYAIRIFDPTLISPQFGVTLGGELGAVKEKFGEPAFILGEPLPGAGQNYIYPINQVGFQLSRSSPNETPRVASILIFNVK
jgi:hypothetical protein